MFNSPDVSGMWLGRGGCFGRLGDRQVESARSRANFRAGAPHHPVGHHGSIVHVVVIGKLGAAVVDTCKRGVAPPAQGNARHASARQRLCPRVDPDTCPNLPRTSPTASAARWRHAVRVRAPAACTITACARRMPP